MKERLVLKKSIRKALNKLLLSIIIFLIGMILVKQNPSIKTPLQVYLYEDSFKFQRIKSFYEKYFGNILSVDKTIKKEKAVFSEKLSYKNISNYKNGVKLQVSDNYMVPVIESGVVVFIGEKEEYGNSIIISQVNNIETIYGNVNINNIKIYDYVEKGELLGEVNGNNLYLSFQKDGKYLDYKQNI